MKITLEEVLQTETTTNEDKDEKPRAPKNNLEVLHDKLRSYGVVGQISSYFIRNWANYIFYHHVICSCYH